MRIPAAVLSLCRTLRAEGYEAWLVGGAVRDSLLGRETDDWDVATDARPGQIAGLFSRTIGTGLPHGTITVVVDGFSCEVTTFRAEVSFPDRRLPEPAAFARTIEEDLSRRDFTVNAIAFDPLDGRFCDPAGGRSDVEARRLRAVGDPHARFREDGLRVLRAARFVATLELDLDPATEEAIRPSLPVLGGVSVERIRDECVKTMRARVPSRGLRVMARTGMLAIVAPELVLMLGRRQGRSRDDDVWEHTLKVVDACPMDDPVLRLAALLHDVGNPLTPQRSERTGDFTFHAHEVAGTDAAGKFTERLRFSSADRGRIVHLVRHHLVWYRPGVPDGTVRRWVRRVGPAHVASICALARAGASARRTPRTELDVLAIDELERRVAALEAAAPIATSATALAIGGRDVMEVLGIGPGRRVGEVLGRLLEAVTDDPALNSRDALLALVKEMGTRQGDLRGEAGG